MKQKYYRLNKILSKEARYNILLGERANGKSYAVKEHVLLDYKNNKQQFVYLRRFQLETKASAVEEYFADMPIEQIFEGKYNTISVYRGHIYLANIDEANKVVRGEKIGYCHYLSGATHFKSRMYPNVYNIIYEEFISNDVYISNEPNELQDYISTILRRRNGFVFLIGNTISRVCPYFSEWQLINIPKMKQGDIDTYEQHTGQYDEDGNEELIQIAVEFCENSGKGSSMFFGKVAENINGGAWRTEEQPHLQDKLENYNKAYEFCVQHMGFSFVCQLLTNNIGSCILYIYPNSRKRKLDRVITLEYSESPFVTTHLKLDIRPEAIAKYCIENNKMAFSDNLTGSEFKQILREMGGV